jgi:hypothetical protein
MLATCALPVRSIEPRENGISSSILMPLRCIKNGTASSWLLIREGSRRRWCCLRLN